MVDLEICIKFYWHTDNLLWHSLVYGWLYFGRLYQRVVWHTSEVLTYSAVDPGFNSRQGHRVYTVLYQYGTLLQQRGNGSVLEHFCFTDAAGQRLSVNLLASGWMWTCRFYTSLGRFSPTPKNQSPHIFLFLVSSLWSHIMLTSLLGCPRFNPRGPLK